MPYTERDVSRDWAAAEEVVRRTGQMGVPVTALGGEMVVGFDRPRLERIVERLRHAAPPSGLGALVKDVPTGRGALVSAVRPGTLAERAGLRAGDVITAVDGQTVAGADPLAALLVAARRRGRATLEVERGGTTQLLRVSFGP